LILLRTTFITPFDRADIKSLITAMDDSIDQMQQTAKAIGAIRGDIIRARDALHG